MRLLSRLALSLFCCVTAFSQTPSAIVVGRITDPTAAIVPGASVKITNLETNIAGHGTSNETGEFTVPHLNPGRYSLEAVASGFRT